MEIDCPVNSSSRERKGLLKVLFLQFGVIPKQLRPLWVRRENLEDAPDRDSDVPDARLATQFPRLDRDAVEWGLQVHATIMARCRRVRHAGRFRGQDSVLRRGSVMNDRYSGRSGGR